MKIGGVLLSVLAVRFSVAAIAEKPDFSGTWLFNKSRSALSDQRLANMDRGVFVVEHKDGLFRVTRTFTFDGKDNVLSFEFPTNGKEVVTEDKGRKALSSIRWLGNTLVFLTRFILPDETATNLVHYTLLDAGKTLLAEETFDGKKRKHHNLWILEKR